MKVNITSWPVLSKEHSPGELSQLGCLTPTDESRVSREAAFSLGLDTGQIAGAGVTTGVSWGGGGGGEWCARAAAHLPGPLLTDGAPGDQSNLPKQSSLKGLIHLYKLSEIYNQMNYMIENQNTLAIQLLFY